ncbi:MAG: 4Fe-4S dicluster domain-containing protein, partial [bacterium]
MADVHNWQIGREMDYPHEESFPDRQFAFVFNINRCIGCQTCTMACKSTWTFSKGQEYMWWNNVETKPYGGYPQNWDKKLLEMLEEKNPGNQVWDATDNDAEEDPPGEQKKPYGTFEGDTIFEALDKSDVDQPQNRVLGYEPDQDEWKAPNIYEDTAYSGSGRNKNGKMDPDAMSDPDDEDRSAELPEHGTWFFYLQRICNHCTYPACLAACPRDAIYKRDEDGVVLIDQDVCRAWRYCFSACPYKKPYYNWRSGKMEKCILCYPRMEEGKPPACFHSCVG